MWPESTKEFWSLESVRMAHLPLLFTWSAPQKYVNHVSNVFVHINENIQYML